MGNAQEIKEKIKQVIEKKGPMLPTDIAREIGIDSLFTSAFLSELVSEKSILSSSMRVGSSAIYYLKEQTKDLEKFQEHIKGKKKEALNLLKENSFLVDEKLEPAIRVALKELNDFAIPFEKNEKLIWRYFIVDENNYSSEEKVKKEKPEEPKKEKKVEEKKIPKKKKARTNTSQKKNEKFFNRVKEFLNRNSIEITDIEGIAKDSLTLRIKRDEKDELLIAYNKKRLTDADFIKAYKKAKEINLRYLILSLGEPSKKISSFIEAIKNLSDLKKIE